MDYTVTLCLLAILPIVLLRLHKNLWKPYAGLPKCNYFYYFLRQYLAGNSPKEVPSTTYFLRYNNALSQVFQKEGLFFGWCGYFNLHVFSPEAVKFFIAEPAATEKGKAYSVLHIAMGQGLVTSDSKTWAQHRKIINPALNRSHFKNFAKVFNRKCLQLVETLKKECKNPSLDLLKILEKNLFDSALETIVGIKGERLTNVEQCQEAVISVMGFCVSRSFKPWVYFDSSLRFFPEGRDFLEKMDFIHRHAQMWIEDFKPEGKKSKPVEESNMGDNYGYAVRKSKPLLNLLLEAHLNNPKAFTMKDVHDEFLTVTGAGYHTIVAACFWTTYLLGLHPEIQENVHEEVSGRMTDELSYDDMQDMPYLESVIKESLRLYPPIPVISRQLEKEVQFGKYTVPRGVEIYTWIYMLHRDPAVFPNPEQFDPSRFAPDKKDDISHFSYMPFAEGPRMCIGKAFSMMELKIVLSHTIRNFTIVSLDQRDTVDLFWSVVLLPVVPPRIQFIPRELSA